MSDEENKGPGGLDNTANDPGTLGDLATAYTLLTGKVPAPRMMGGGGFFPGMASSSFGSSMTNTKATESPMGNNFDYTSSTPTKRFWKWAAALVCAGAALFILRPCINQKYRNTTNTSTGFGEKVDYSVSREVLRIKKGGGNKAYCIVSKISNGQFVDKKVRVRLPDYLVVNAVNKETDENGIDIYRIDPGYGGKVLYIQGRFLENPQDPEKVPGRVDPYAYPKGTYIKKPYPTVKQPRGLGKPLGSYTPLRRSESELLRVRNRTSQRTLNA